MTSCWFSSEHRASTPANAVNVFWLRSLTSGLCTGSLCCSVLHRNRSITRCHRGAWVQCLWLTSSNAWFVRLQNTDWNSSLRFHKIGRDGLSCGAKPKKEQIMREDSSGWNKSVLPPMAVAAWPRVDLTPADDMQPNWVWKLTPQVHTRSYHTTSRYCLYAAARLYSLATQHWVRLYLVIQKWRVKSFRAQLCKEHKAMLVVASKRGGSTSLAICSMLIQIINPPKIYCQSVKLRSLSNAPYRFLTAGAEDRNVVTVADENNTELSRSSRVWDRLSQNSIFIIQTKEEGRR